MSARLAFGDKVTEKHSVWYPRSISLYRTVRCIYWTAVGWHCCCCCQWRRRRIRVGGILSPTLATAFIVAFRRIWVGRHLTLGLLTSTRRRRIMWGWTSRVINTVGCGSWHAHCIDVHRVSKWWLISHTCCTASSSIHICWPVRPTALPSDYTHSHQIYQCKQKFGRVWQFYPRSHKLTCKKSADNHARANFSSILCIQDAFWCKVMQDDDAVQWFNVHLEADEKPA